MGPGSRELGTEGILGRRKPVEVSKHRVHGWISGGQGRSGEKRPSTAATPPPRDKVRTLPPHPLLCSLGSICRAQSPESGLRAQLTPP